MLFLKDNEDDEWNDYIGKCIVQFDYKATRGDELTILKGDTIHIIEKQNDGWWKGQLAQSNQTGLFPSTYVQET